MPILTVLEQYQQGMYVLVDKGAWAVISGLSIGAHCQFSWTSSRRRTVCLLEGYLCMHGAPHLESLCLMQCDTYAAHAPGAHPFHPCTAQLPVPQLVRLLSAIPSLAHLDLKGPSPAFPDPPRPGPMPPPPPRAPVLHLWTSTPLPHHMCIPLHLRTGCPLQPPHLLMPHVRLCACHAPGARQCGPCSAREATALLLVHIFAPLARRRKPCSTCD
jgi:hypothetical protein